MIRALLACAVLACAVLGSGCCTVGGGILLLDSSGPRGERTRIEPAEVHGVWLEDGHVKVLVRHADNALALGTWRVGTELEWADHRSAGLGDPKLLGLLEESDRLAAAGRWLPAVASLDAALAAAGDRLVDCDGRLVRGRELVFERLAALPAEGREAYELRHGAAAAELLEQGLSWGGEGSLRRLLAEHPASAEAWTARRLLAERRVEAGDLLGAFEALAGALPSPGDRVERGRAARLAASVKVLLAARGLEAPRFTRLPSGYHVEGHELVVEASGSRVDLRKPGPWGPPPRGAGLVRGLKTLLFAVALPVTVAVDLTTWPVQALVALFIISDAI